MNGKNKNNIIIQSFVLVGGSTYIPDKPHQKTFCRQTDNFNIYFVRLFERNSSICNDVKHIALGLILKQLQSLL